MRIAFVITGLHVGGAEKAIAALAIGCRAAGDDVAVFSLQPLPPRGGGRDAIAERLRAAGVPIATGNATGTWSMIRVIWRLRRWLFDHQPDVTQSFLYHANVLTAAASRGHRYRRVAGLRVAETRAGRMFWERLALQSFDHVVAVSERVKDFGVSPFGLVVPKHKISVIANGVQIPDQAETRFDWTSVGVPAGRNVVLVAGRLHWQKGIKRLIGRLDAGWRPGGGSASLVFVGDGPLRGKLQAAADRVNANLPGSVIVAGWRADAGVMIAGCDVLLLASHYEGMANVLLEAMAAGRAVVCSDVEGVDELLPGDNRQVVPINDDTALTRRVDWLLGDRESRQTLGQHNRRRAARRFGEDRMIEAYRRLYQRVRLD